MNLPATASAPARVPVTPAQAAIEAEYESDWDAMQLRPERLGGTMLAAKRILAGKETYKKVELALGVPWPVVGVAHERESSCDFKTHLHNGDTLKKRTTHVPAGRPLNGSPPFAWFESAVDALTMKNWHRVDDWTIGRTARLLEEYNGLGYRNRGLPSPYVLAGSNLYTKGKYVSDGKFSASFVDPQPGCLPLIQCLIQLDPSIRAALPEADERIAKPVEISDALPAPSIMKEAATSPTVHATVWAAIMLKITAVASTIGAGIDWALQSLPSIKSDVDTQMAVVNGLASTARIDLASVGAWIGVGLLLYVAFQHLDLKSWLNRGGVK